MTAAEREFLILCARLWLGTPFAWGQRLIGHGVDCVQLVIGAGRNAGLLECDPMPPGKYPPMVALRRDWTIRTLLAPHMDTVPHGEPGDVVWYRTRRQIPMHFGILTRAGIIHASEAAGKVVETPFSKSDRSRVIGYYRFRGQVNG